MARDLLALKKLARIVTLRVLQNLFYSRKAQLDAECSVAVEPEVVTSGMHSP